MGNIQNLPLQAKKNTEQTTEKNKLTKAKLSRNLQVLDEMNSVAYSK